MYGVNNGLLYEPSTLTYKQELRIMARTGQWSPDLYSILMGESLAPSPVQNNFARGHPACKEARAWWSKSKNAWLKKKDQPEQPHRVAGIPLSASQT